MCLCATCFVPHPLCHNVFMKTSKDSPSFLQSVPRYINLMMKPLWEINEVDECKRHSLKNLICYNISYNSLKQ